jgi:hypothetical protein
VVCTAFGTHKVVVVAFEAVKLGRRGLAPYCSAVEALACHTLSIIERSMFMRSRARTGKTQRHTSWGRSL